MFVRIAVMWFLSLDSSSQNRFQISHSSAMIPVLDKYLSCSGRSGFLVVDWANTASTQTSQTSSSSRSAPATPRVRLTPTHTSSALNRTKSESRGCQSLRRSSTARRVEVSALYFTLYSSHTYRQNLNRKTNVVKNILLVNKKMKSKFFKTLNFLWNSE